MTISAGTATPPQQTRYRWMMLALVWLGYFMFGCVSYSLPPLSTPIMGDLGISYSQMGIILGSWPLAYVVVATFAGAMMDRWGIRRSIFLGLVLIGLSGVMRVFADNFATMFLSVALFGLGGPMMSIGCPKTISVWFAGKERGTAVGIYMTGPWVGGALVLSTMNSVIMPLVGQSWRLAFAVFGGISLAVAVIWWFLARDIKSTGQAEGLNKVFRHLISVKNVQLLVVMGFISFAIGHGFNDWLPRILEIGGLSPAMAGAAASLPVWISVPTVILVPRLVAMPWRGRAIAVFSVFVAAALVIIAMSSGGRLVTGLVIYGLSYCCVLPLLVLILMDLPEVGAKYMGSASGVFFCIAELGGFIGPFLVGMMKDLFGGFLAGACLLAAISLVRMAIALFLKVRPPRLS